MIIEQTGNILDSTCEHIVIPVNTMGVMGKGLAKEFAERYPKLKDEYMSICKHGFFGWKPGGGSVFAYDLRDYKFLMLATKEDWRQPSKIEWIDIGLKKLQQMTENQIDGYDYEYVHQAQVSSSIAIPPLGCGLGGLNWDYVYSLIQKYLGNIKGLTVHVYLPR
jgi:O-acetyl-ADP-ribose deacetylase (regulator of RNase III)